jgi:hypothetical protein
VRDRRHSDNLSNTLNVASVIDGLASPALSEVQEDESQNGSKEQAPRKNDCEE